MKLRSLMNMLLGLYIKIKIKEIGKYSLYIVFITQTPKF